MDNKKNNLIEVGNDIVVSTLNLTRDLINEFGERVAGSPQCLASAKKIAELFKPNCDTVNEEFFQIHPASFWNVGRIVALSYIISIALLLKGGFLVYIAAVLNLFGLIYGITLYILFERAFDMLFPSAKACNVAGIIEPTDKVKQQIIVAGHHDSPYVLSFLEHFQLIAGIRLLLAIIIYLISTFACLYALISQLIFKNTWLLHGFQLWLLIIGLIFVLPLFFLFSAKKSPGAGDNLNATSIAIKLAEFFNLRRQQGLSLKNTRLILLSPDAEEAGLRGGYDYAIRHKPELAAVPSFVINIDCLYKLPYIAVLKRDRNDTISLSKQMADDFVNLATELGISLKKIDLPLGKGGTDAAAFMKYGVESTSIIGISTSLLIKDVVYHTTRDTVDHIEPEAVKAAFELIINYIINTDSKN